MSTMLVVVFLFMLVVLPKCVCVCVRKAPLRQHNIACGSFIYPILLSLSRRHRAIFLICSVAHERHGVQHTSAFLCRVRLVGALIVQALELVGSSQFLQITNVHSDVGPFATHTWRTP